MALPFYAVNSSKEYCYTTDRKLAVHSGFPIQYATFAEIYKQAYNYSTDCKSGVIYKVPISNKLPPVLIKKLEGYRDTEKKGFFKKAFDKYMPPLRHEIRQWALQSSMWTYQQAEHKASEYGSMAELLGTILVSFAHVMDTRPVTEESWSLIKEGIACADKTEDFSDDMRIFFEKKQCALEADYYGKGGAYKDLDAHVDMAEIFGRLHARVIDSTAYASAAILDVLTYDRGVRQAILFVPSLDEFSSDTLSVAEALQECIDILKMMTCDKTVNQENKKWASDLLHSILEKAKMTEPAAIAEA